MKLKHLIQAMSLLGVAVLSTPAAHAADLVGWYGGISIGQSEEQDFSASELDSELNDAGFTTSGTSVDDTDTGWKLFAGYQFNNYFALEGGYISFGRFDASTTVTAVNGSPITPTSVNATVKARNGFLLDAVGILPITDNFSVFGKLGAYTSKTELSASVDGASASDSDWDSDLTYGFGVNYAINKDLRIRGEWERFEKVGSSDSVESDIDLLSIGLTYQFY
ncbi:outer membrane beta-barrel protein [Pseudogulbenkiania sp. MAI-1]|uniref:outer membrane beta-barrel protein n=1 Tax=Pseudogulbenkiania sp. MAI-1 TaxID=990370 RepID=UPI00055EBD9F|nr:outer membrane beta-barrel protein [Pseudogulbenkiania sp. MAI-1]